MLRPADYGNIIVTVAHPSGDIETTLRQWIETGPGPRPFVTITVARRRNGEPISLEAIPPEYRNSPLGELTTAVLVSAAGSPPARVR